MRYKQEVLKPQLETVELICDCCGAKDSDWRQAHHGDPMPAIKIEGGWGDNSRNKDFQFHTTWLCEECYDKIVAQFGINPLVKHYRPHVGRTPQSERMYVNLTDEQANSSIIDSNDGYDGYARYEKEDWLNQGKQKLPPVDKFRDWAHKFIDELLEAERFGGPPPEGREVREYKHKIAAELRELF